MPVGIQISVNVILFIITAVYCNRVKAEIHRMQMIDNCEQKKKRFIADKAMWVMCCWMAWKSYSRIGIHHANFIEKAIKGLLKSFSCQLEQKNPQIYLIFFLYFVPIRFLMNLKLFVVMGISWLLEIVDTLIENQQFWGYVSDAFNLLQGVLVFLIFVFKKKVFVSLQKKLGKFNTFETRDTCGQEKIF